MQIPYLLTGDSEKICYTVNIMIIKKLLFGKMLWKSSKDTREDFVRNILNNIISNTINEYINVSLSFSGSNSTVTGLSVFEPL